MSDPAKEARFQQLLEAHQRILFKVCNAYCRNPEDRRDLLQDMVVQVWRSFDRFDGRCQFSTWMYRIALNVAVSFRRAEHTRTRPLVQDEGHLLDLPARPDPAPPSEELALLHRFIDGLPGLDKALLLLYLDDRSHQEIADVLGITPSHVSTKIGRLKLRLRNQAAAPSR